MSAAIILLLDISVQKGVHHPAFLGTELAIHASDVVVMPNWFIDISRLFHLLDHIVYVYPFYHFVLWQ